MLATISRAFVTQNNRGSSSSSRTGNTSSSQSTISREKPYSLNDLWAYRRTLLESDNAEAKKLGEDLSQLQTKRTHNEIDYETFKVEAIILMEKIDDAKENLSDQEYLCAMEDIGLQYNKFKAPQELPNNNRPSSSRNGRPTAGQEQLMWANLFSALGVNYYPTIFDTYTFRDDLTRGLENFIFENSETALNSIDQTNNDRTEPTSQQRSAFVLSRDITTGKYIVLLDGGDIVFTIDPANPIISRTHYDRLNFMRTERYTLIMQSNEEVANFFSVLNRASIEESPEQDLNATVGTTFLKLTWLQNFLSSLLRFLKASFGKE